MRLPIAIADRPTMSSQPAAPGTVLIDTVTMHADARGAVFEPVDAAGLAGQRNTHVVISEPGATRGNHRHRVGHEVTVVVGPAIVRYREAGVVHEVQVPYGLAQRFRFPAGVSHAFRNPGPGQMILASFNSEVHDPAHPDLERDELF
jgi:dTDP-4-dehydrorhamnose 3,5-epimerase-like enzyme